MLVKEARYRELKLERDELQQRLQEASIRLTEMDRVKQNLSDAALQNSLLQNRIGQIEHGYEMQASGLRAELRSVSEELESVRTQNALLRAGNENERRRVESLQATCNALQVENRALRSDVEVVAQQVSSNNPSITPLRAIASKYPSQRGAHAVPEGIRDDWIFGSPKHSAAARSDMRRTTSLASFIAEGGDGCSGLADLKLLNYVCRMATTDPALCNMDVLITGTRSSGKTGVMERLIGLDIFPSHPSHTPVAVTLTPDEGSDCAVITIKVTPRVVD